MMEVGVDKGASWVMFLPEGHKAVTDRDDIFELYQ